MTGGLGRRKCPRPPGDPDVLQVQVGGTESKLGRSVGCPRLPADLRQGACGLEAEAVPQSRLAHIKPRQQLSQRQRPPWRRSRPSAFPVRRCEAVLESRSSPPPGKNVLLCPLVESKRGDARGGRRTPTVWEEAPPTPTPQEKSVAGPRGQSQRSLTVKETSATCTNN